MRDIQNIISVCVTHGNTVRGRPDIAKGRNTLEARQYEVERGSVGVDAR